MELSRDGSASSAEPSEHCIYGTENDVSTALVHNNDRIAAGDGS